MSEKIWYKVARNIIKAGAMPIPISNTLLELLKTIITEEQAQFIAKAFNRKPNLNSEELKKKIVGLDKEKLEEMLETLQYNGIITATQSKSTGMTIYRLLNPYPGLFEFQLMRPGNSPRERKIASLFDSLFAEMSEMTAKSYDTVIPQFKNFPPVDRIIPVEQEVQGGTELILGKEDVNKIIDKYDDIALAYCYCRHEKDLLDKPCKLNGPRNNCLLFYKTAQFCIDKGFAIKIDKEKAKEILREAEDAGLVHKAFHISQDPEKPLQGICSCCPCCCGIFQMYYRGIMPYYTRTNYLARVNEDDCTACGTCESICPIKAVELVDAVAVVNEQKCIGCGLCAHHCPERAVHLTRFEEAREVFIPPPKIQQEK